jgi:hypothetical protein
VREGSRDAGARPQLPPQVRARSSLQDLETSFRDGIIFTANGVPLFVICLLFASSFLVNAMFFVPQEPRTLWPRELVGLLTFFCLDQLC